MSFLFSPYGAHGLFFGGRVTSVIKMCTVPPPTLVNPCPCIFDQWIITGLKPATIFFPSGVSFGAPAIGKQAIGIFAPAKVPPCAGSHFSLGGFRL